MLSRRLPALTKRSVQATTRAAIARTPIALARRSIRLVSASTPSLSHTRRYTTPAPQLNANSELTSAQYHAYSDVTMETLLDSLEDLLDDITEADYEVEYSSGVLTLQLGDHGTYVINKQPPNQQIWLSSPLSGPKRYDFVPKENKWIYSRDQRSLGQLLDTELSKILERDVHLGVDDCVVP